MKFIIAICVIFAAFTVQTIVAVPDIAAILNIVWNSFGNPSKTILNGLNDGTLSGNYSTGLQEANEIYANLTNEFAQNVSTLLVYFVQNTTANLATEAAAFAANLTANMTATTVQGKMLTLSSLFALYTPLGPTAEKLAASLTDLNEIKIPALLAEIDATIAPWKAFAAEKIQSANATTNNNETKIAKVAGLVNAYVANAEQKLNECAGTIQTNIYTLTANIYNSVSRYLKATLELEGHIETCLIPATTAAKCTQLTNPGINIVKPSQSVLIGFQTQATALNSTSLNSTPCTTTIQANFLLGKYKLQTQIDAALK